jgi:cobyrinic acid a,c-diamide synthase
MIQCPRLTIAGLGGDTGKTAVSVGLCRAWKKQGYRVVPFKNGPDYIDMGWMSRGAGHPCYNIDLFLMNQDQVLSSFSMNTRNADIAVIEGNRGLYDGMDADGSVSTAEVAKLLQAPVILIVDCTKVTRTVAALVLGCQTFDPAVPIKGVVLNRLAGSRHESVIRQSIERYCHVPVLGAIPKLKNINFPGRHLGLVPPQEHPVAEDAIEKAAAVVSEYLDIQQLWQVRTQAPTIILKQEPVLEIRDKQVTIGVIRDSAFQFYYTENIEALERAGAHIVEFSALTDSLPSSLDALYIGGGFPETHAEALSANQTLREAVRNAAEEGMPVYAECGGLMYLAETLLWEGRPYEMAGVLPIVIAVSKKPQGHGYTIAEVKSPNPYFSPGHILHGHEFHYSHVLEISEKKGISFVFAMQKGQGIMNKMDGFCYKNVLATYTHIHALGTREWVDGMIRMAQSHKGEKFISK